MKPIGRTEPRKRRSARIAARRPTPHETPIPRHSAETVAEASARRSSHPARRTKYGNRLLWTGGPGNKQKY